MGGDCGVTTYIPGTVIAFTTGQPFLDGVPYGECFTMSPELGDTTMRSYVTMREVRAERPRRCGREMTMIVANSKQEYDSCLGKIVSHLGFTPKIEIHAGHGTRGGDYDTDEMVAKAARGLRGKVMTSDIRLMAIVDAWHCVRTKSPDGEIFTIGKITVAQVETALSQDHRVGEIAEILMANVIQDAEAARVLHPNVVVEKWLAARCITTQWCRVQAAAILAASIEDAFVH